MHAFVHVGLSDICASVSVPSAARCSDELGSGQSAEFHHVQKCSQRIIARKTCSQYHSKRSMFNMKDFCRYKQAFQRYSLGVNISLARNKHVQDELKVCLDPTRTTSTEFKIVSIKTISPVNLCGCFSPKLRKKEKPRQKHCERIQHDRTANKSWF